MEVDDEGSPAVVTPSAVQLDPPNLDEEIAQIVDMLWGQTEVLAQQNARLNLQQHVHVNNQNAALMAVRENAEHGVNRLAQHHRETVVEMERLLQETRAAMHEQIRALAHQRTTQLDERIQNVLLEAVAARQLADQQATEAQRIEADMATAMSRLHADLSQRIEGFSTSNWETTLNTQLEERWKQLQGEIAEKIQEITNEIVHSNLAGVERRLQAKGPVSNRVQQLVDSSTTAAESRIESKMRETLKQHQEKVDDAIRQQTANQDEEREALITARVGEVSMESEKRIEERMRQLLREARTDISGELKRHANEQRIENKAVSSRIDMLSARVASLESSVTAGVPRMTPANQRATESTQKSSVQVEDSQRIFAQGIMDATHKIVGLYKQTKQPHPGSATSKRAQPAKNTRKIGNKARPVSSAKAPSRIAGIVAEVQEEVRKRAEAIARSYEQGKQTKL